MTKQSTYNVLEAVHFKIVSDRVKKNNIFILTMDNG